MDLHKYVASLDARRKLGNATEHTYRGDLQQLLEALVPSITATNEPKRRECGAPDYILTKKGVPVGFIEAKDIGDNDLEGRKKTGNKEQFDRYRSSLDNVIFTDYINFLFYRDGEIVTRIAIAEVQGGGVIPLHENFDRFENLIEDFCSHVGQTIKSSKRLAEMMAGKARLLSNIIEKSLLSDEESEENSTLKEQMLAFQQVLINDITPEEFADVYAQTIAYGMFAARLHDPTLDSFSRQEAAELIPKSNPFLRKLFGYIAGPEIDDRIKWVVENLSAIFLACNVAEILSEYGKATRVEDPIIHFYETFLSEYDPKLRKSRGVWYTPQPVVDFIVRAVDNILKTDFDLQNGLADTTKTTIQVDTQMRDKRSATGYKRATEEVHKVQILDPATGTGTFLATVIKHIHKKFQGQQGIWNNYVSEHLLPRLNGFELLMASYAMAHLKMDLLLTETGFQSTSNQRLRVYLTNSLVEFHEATGTLFANWLSAEANAANHIKRNTPVMCVMGNPPYSKISSNNFSWIKDLVDEYKYVDGSHFNERKHGLDDDYVKFVRYGQYLIERNGSGVMAYITPHGYLDNITFRGMRRSLLSTFDTIKVIDLHGNSNIKETSPDGSPDQNVFDIKQGVALTLFIKTGKKKAVDLGEVFHADLYGKRQAKYDFLLRNDLDSIQFQSVKMSAPNYFFNPKDLSGRETYEKGFSLNELFTNNSTGIITAGDSFIVDRHEDQLIHRITDFLNHEYTEAEFKSKYGLGKNYAKWVLENRDVLRNIELTPIDIAYRPFDNYKTIFHNKLLWRWRHKTMKHMLSGDNVGLILKRTSKFKFSYVFLTDKPAEGCLFESAYANNSLLPLYLYPEKGELAKMTETQTRVPNLDNDIVNQIASSLGLEFTSEKEENEHAFAPIDLLDYIYAVLHSPEFRETYESFLKINFPIIPYPANQDRFWALVELGGKLRQLHLFQHSLLEQFITKYPISGDNVISCDRANSFPSYEAQTKTHGKVFINDQQYFDNVPLVAWQFQIGGYEPAQKWLKDRRGNALSFGEVTHYQKVIVALAETDRLMQEVDRVIAL